MRGAWRFGNILYLIESAKELLLRIYKDIKGTNTTKRNLLRPNKH
jgi:hypothetical protein